MSSAPFSLPQFGVSLKGKATNLAQGTQAQIGIDQFNAQTVSQVGMPYGFMTLAGLMCTGTWPAAAAAALSATALSAWSLYNPAGSNVNIHLQSITAVMTAFTAQAASSAVGILPFTQTPTSTTTTGTAKANCLIGTGNAVQGVQYVTGTTVGAVTVPIRWIGGIYTDLAAGDTPATLHDEIAGSMIIPPGSGIQIGAVGGTVADLTIAVSMTWAEIPV